MSIVLQESLKVNSFSELRSIFKGDGRYDFFTDGVEIETAIQNVDRGSEGRVFVLFSGARDPSKQPLPKFDRWKWINSFPGIIVNISDPTLHFHEKQLRIGWYYGTKEQNYSFWQKMNHTSKLHSSLPLASYLLELYLCWVYLKCCKLEQMQSWLKSNLFQLHNLIFY